MKRFRLPFAQLFGLFMLVLTGFDAKAIESVGSGNWANGNTWSGGVAPTNTTAVTVKSGHSITVSTASQICLTLQIEAGGSVFVQGGAAGLTCLAAMTVDGTFIHFGTFVHDVYVIEIGAGGLFELRAGTMTMDNLEGFSGAGTVKISNPTGLGSVLNFNAGSSCTSKLLIDGGTVNEEVGISPDAFELRSFSTFQGSGSPVFSNGFVWTGGEIGGSGSVTVTGAASFGTASPQMKGSKTFRLGTAMTLGTSFVLLEDSKMEI